MVHSDSFSHSSLLRWVARAVVAVFFIQSIPLQAWAEPETAKKTPPNAAIVGFRTGKTEQEEKVRTVLNKQIGSNKDFMLMDEATVVSKLQDYSYATVDPKSQSIVTGAYEHYTAGIQFYRKLDFTNALKEFNASVRGYREGISILRDNYYLLFSHLYLGIILHFLGRVDEGKKFIQQMVMLDAERKTRVLPQRDFPPKIVELHKQITKEILSSPMSTLSVDSIPPGAKIIFDGSEIGKTSFQIKDIPPGQHFIALELQGFQFYGAPIQINPGPQNFVMGLKEKNIFQTYLPEARTDAAKADLKNIAEVLQTDLLILGQTELKDKDIAVSMQIFDARTSTFSDVFQETTSAKKPKFQTLPQKVKDFFNPPSKASAPVVAPKAALPAAKNTAPAPVTVPPAPAAKTVTPAPATTPVPAAKKPTALNTTEINLSDFDPKEAKQSDTSSSNSFFKTIYKKWWFWGVIGAAAVGSGSYLLFRDTSSNSNVVTVQNPL